MKPLGVGVVFVPRLLPFLQRAGDLLSVIELEPQTLWQFAQVNGHPEYHLNQQRFAEFLALPYGKLMHSVGLPFGGSEPLDSPQVEMLGAMAGRIDPPWVSDHLSFNAFHDGHTWSSAGFFLPPHQTGETVAVASTKIRSLSVALDRPVAFETGVNYLRPQPDELGDGEFFAAVASAADSGILLDLHNVWVNQCNGRQRADEVIAALPLNRVWELHVAGGTDHMGRRIDAHCGSTPEEVWDLAAKWIPRMPNLGAMIFEVLDENVDALGVDGIAEEVDRMRRLWALRAPGPEMNVPRPVTPVRATSEHERQSVERWETTLASLVIGREPHGERGHRLSRDPGIALFQDLVAEARAGLIAEGLRNTMSLLLKTIGPPSVKQLLAAFMASRPPTLYASAESDAFATFLEGQSLAVPYLQEVLPFEHALIRAALYGEPSTVQFDHDPADLFSNLEAGILPHPRRLPSTMALLVGT